MFFSWWQKWLLFHLVYTHVLPRLHHTCMNPPGKSAEGPSAASSPSPAARASGAALKSPPASRFFHATTWARKSSMALLNGADDANSPWRIQRTTLPSARWMANAAPPVSPKDASRSARQPFSPSRSDSAISHWKRMSTPSTCENVTSCASSKRNVMLQLLQMLL